jgi:hypothetical protein
MTECNHLWHYCGSKRQQAWQCGYCQAWRFTEPVAKREWVGLTRDEVLNIEETAAHPLEFYRAIEAKLKEKNT